MPEGLDFDARISYERPSYFAHLNLVQNHHWSFGDLSGMPKGDGNARIRKPYAAQACTVCRAKKTKCDGAKPVCGYCATSGRDKECLWGRGFAARKPRTEAHFEALRKRADSLQAYCDLLEEMLGKCTCQDVSSLLQSRPSPPEELDGGAFSDSDDEITQELTIPTQSLKLDKVRGGLLLHGTHSPFRFITGLPHEVMPTEDMAQKSNSSYVLLIDGVDVSEIDPDIDWSRYLPPEVVLERDEHDKILDLCFKFYVMWSPHIISLFLRDMHRALSTQPRPRTPHYSPMLHNAFLAVSANFSDDPYLRDVKTREYFANAAKVWLETECKKPDVSFVYALALLGTYHLDIADRLVAELYFGMCNTIGTSLGLGVDSKAWAKSGLFTHDDIVSRNWAYWSTFSTNVLLGALFGTESYGPRVDASTIPLPLVDSEADQITWHHSSAKVPPQPNLLSLAFHQSCSLFGIAQRVVDFVNGLRGSGQPIIKVDEHITKLDLELNNWKGRLPPELDITPGNRAVSTPQRLLLHCEYWWCSIILHQPFFNRRAQPVLPHGDPVDHVKLCKRAADNILELMETYSSVYTMRNVSVRLLQILFSAGTVFVLLAIQATANLRIGQFALKTALAQVELCIRYLNDIGETWMCAARTGAILRGVVNGKLRPLIARRIAPRPLEDFVGPAVPPETPPAPVADAIANMLPASTDTTSYVAAWNHLPDRSSADWPQIPSDVFSQPHDDVLFNGLGEWQDPVAQNALPEWDVSEFLSTFDWFGAPMMWEEEHP
ncbi:hypothetical protein B0H11DRAFT_193192 [Mycena galericulata]|nr:hypothetical protein B0H11DRAFT_193192 [Mycena galericulata]